MAAEISSMQVGVFSATLPPEALEITRKFMNKPVSCLLLLLRVHLRFGSPMSRDMMLQMCSSLL